ncbi:DHH family phosphoesterase [Candidatus Babeliales bacterium]|nr:DHH family phosphoesterase [Candidatus Babeliales bacterium]
MSQTNFSIDRYVTQKFGEEKVLEAWEHVKAAKSITLLTHASADADALCSCAALADFLISKDKKIEVVLLDQPKIKPFYKVKPIYIGRHVQSPDLIMVLDTANRERMYWTKEFDGIPLINIDHHRDSTFDVEFNFVDQKASSACQVLASFLVAWDESAISSFAAEALLCGLLDDSIIFRSQLSDAKTLRVAAFLIDAGSDFLKVKTRILTYKSSFVVKFWGMVLSRIKNIKGNSLSVASIAQSDFEKFGTDKSVLGGFVNFFAGLVSSDIVLMLVEKEDGTVKGSFRSKYYNVSELANKLGGGGHKNAAGFELVGTLQDAEKEVISKF